MPIYAYRCTTCGHAQDVLRKISDPPLEVCPACGAATYVKQVTAAGFQLKGSGWYVTDFRGDNNKKPAKPAEGADGKPVVDAKPGEAAAAAPSETKSEAKKADAAPAAAAPAAAPAPAPTTTPPTKGST
jgi:putative FmdB family regulatory protein